MSSYRKSPLSFAVFITDTYEDDMRLCYIFIRWAAFLTASHTRWGSRPSTFIQGSPASAWATLPSPSGF